MKVLSDAGWSIHRPLTIDSHICIFFSNDKLGIVTLTPSASAFISPFLSSFVNDSTVFKRRNWPLTAAVPRKDSFDSERRESVPILSSEWNTIEEQVSEYSQIEIEAPTGLEDSSNFHSFNLRRLTSLQKDASTKVQIGTNCIPDYLLVSIIVQKRKQKKLKCILNWSLNC